MSDITIDLLEAIDAKITTERNVGGVLEGLKSHFVLFTSADTPPEYGSQSPMLVVSMLAVTGEVISIPPCMTQKLYPIQFTIFAENAGNTQRKAAVELLDLVETSFYQQTFGLSEWVDLVERNTDQVIAPPFSGNWVGVGSLTIGHTYTDIRGVVMPLKTARTVSPDITVISTSTLSVAYDVLRIQGDVTLISTPTIYAGVDGQLLTIQGLNDAAMPTLQDESDLVGSGLRLEYMQPFTLGKNDTIDFMYDAGQVLWLEQRRTDLR